MPPPIFFATHAQRSQIPHPDPGWGRGVGRVAVPTPRTRRCRRKSRPGPGPRGGREAAGAQSRAFSSPPCRSGYPPSLVAPYPLLVRRRWGGVAPAGVSHFPRREEEGAQAAWWFRRAGSGEGGLRWGPETARQPGITGASAHAWEVERGHRKDYLGREWRGGRLPWATMYMERKDVSNLGDPLWVWERGCVMGAIPRGPGAGTGQEPRKQCGTTILLGPGL